MLVVASPALGQADPAPAAAETARCDARQAAVDRAWLLYASKHTVNPSQPGTVGARILGLSSYMQHCAVADAKLIDLAPLGTGELALLREFAPAGPMSELAGCLFTSSADKAVDFVLASDVAAYREYAESRQMGALDEQALVTLLESADGCGALVPETLRGNELYADLNWFARIRPNLDRIVSWHSEAAADG